MTSLKMRIDSQKEKPHNYRVQWSFNLSTESAFVYNLTGHPDLAIALMWNRALRDPPHSPALSQSDMYLYSSLLLVWVACP
jgi:hypothetical protein